MKLTIPDPALVLLVGPSGAGKSTFARAHFGPTEIVASDAMRQMLSNDPADQGASAEAFALLSILINGRLRRRLMTVVDATSLRAANRTRYRRLAAVGVRNLEGYREKVRAGVDGCEAMPHLVIVVDELAVLDGK